MRQNYGFPSVNEDQVERITHNYDAYGQPIPSQEEESNIHVTQERHINDADQWNFEVDSDQSRHENPPDHPPQQRPDTNAFPSAHNATSPPRGPGARRRNSLSRRRPSDGAHELRDLSLSQGATGNRGESTEFRVRFALRGHLDVVRSVIFTGGGTPAEPEICTTGDDGVIKRWIIPASYSAFGTHGSSTTDLDIASYFTHRGHTSSVMCLASAPASPHFLNGGRALGDGWVFSGGQDATVRVWERGRVDPKATLEGHSDAVWTVCVLPAASAASLGDSSGGRGTHGTGSERVLLASGAADGTIILWAVSAPPQLPSPQPGSRRGAGGRRRNPFDTAVRPGRSLFDRIEAAAGPSRRRSRSRSRSPQHPRRSNTRKPPPDGIDRYVPGEGPRRSRSRSPPRRRDGGGPRRNGGGAGVTGRRGGPRKDDDGRPMLQGRPRMTQEELDRDMCVATLPSL